MHEMGLCENILNIALEAAGRNNARKIVKITVKAGEMRGVVESQMKFCFGFMAKDTIAENAELVIEKVEISASCKSCGMKFTVREFNFTCGSCSSSDLEIHTGKELMVKDIEVD